MSRTAKQTAADKFRADARRAFERGAAYYPDYVGATPRPTRDVVTGSIKSLGGLARIRSDFARMRAQHLHAIRMGEFSWSTVEPEPGRMCPEIFLATLDLAHEHGIDVLFCTPTATPPKWLIDAHPDILPWTRDGKRIPFGSRRHYDVNHPVYRSESERITRAYVEAFGAHPAVVGWQTDNEFGCHNSVFVFSAHARAGFQEWLRRKYQGDIAALNEALFTAFWSQGYTDFSQIELPSASWADQNPGLELEFRRFSNESVVSFQKAQIDIIRAGSPGRFVTHNLMTLFTDLCPWSIARDLDEVGFDHYQMEREPHPVSSHWQFALMRALRMKKFLVLEQQPVQVNWQSVNRRFSYDWLFLWGLQAAFLGARGMHYFSWQRMYGGAEQYHDGIVPHDVRVERSPQEAVLAAKEELFDRLCEHFDFAELPMPRKDVMCIYDSESVWSHEITAQSTAYSTRAQVDSVARMCCALGLGLTFAPSIEAARGHLHEAQVLVLPGHAFEFTSGDKDVLKRFLDQGGRVLSFPRTAMKRRDNQMSPLPFALFDPSEFHFEDHGALLPEERETFHPAPAKASARSVAKGAPRGKGFEGTLWAEKIAIRSRAWKPAATFSGGLFHGWPAVMLKKTFKEGGRHMHFATCPTPDGALVKWISASAQLDLETPIEPAGVNGLQVIPARLGNRMFLYCVNFDESPHVVRMRPGWRLERSLECVLTEALDARGQAKGNKPSKKDGGSDSLRVPRRGILVAEFAPRRPRKGQA